MTEDASLKRGLVFNIQRFSIHDGPGIRTTVFLKGCPLHCPWCSNPESIHHAPEVFLRSAKCIKCETCQKVCTENAITVSKSGAHIDRERCNSCFECTKACPSKALEKTGCSMSVIEVLDIVLRDAGYYQHSDGGLTLSGGEPLAQAHFAEALLMEAKRKGLSTAIETSGYAEWSAFDKALKRTDLVLYDLKHIDSTRHREATGVSNDLILANLKKTLSETAVRVWIRIPIIPNFNDSTGTIERMRGFIQRLPRLPEKVSMLPFHKLGLGKYAALGKVYEYENAPLIDKEEIDEYKRIIESNGIKVDIGF